MRYAGFWALFAVAAFIAVLVPRFLSSRDRIALEPGGVRVERPAVLTGEGGEDMIVIDATPGGSYLTEVLVENVPIEVLVDTGASFFTLTEDDAARLGILPRRRDFTFEFSTANGTIRAARAEVSAVEIGPGRIDDVTVFVLPEGRLDVSLLGMNVLRRFGSVSFDRDRLTIAVE